ncbi:MAG TPA: mucoidy inhibitor MuiA family protein [Verrucomicrobiae bacterium]|nr:mucoidy inhibitor MuiA family protein [Verrucomicrobiae bacterium]
MNRIRLFAVLSATLLSARSWAIEPVTVESHITDVTVYPDRAQVTRSADINVNPGENRLLVDHLPVTLAEDSVKAAGKAPIHVIIQDVAVRTVVREQPSDTKAAEMGKRVQDLHDEREALESRQRVIDQQRLLLQQIQVKAAGDVSRDIQLNKFDVTQLKDLPAFVGSEFARLEDDTRKVAAERRELDRKIAAAEAEFGKYQSAANRAEKSVLVIIDAKDATKLHLQISYVLGNASWVPAYDARAAADASGVELTYNAVVRQQTGEDWLGVNLALSTAKPAVGAQMPDLNKWSVGILEAVLNGPMDGLAETAKFATTPPPAAPALGGEERYEREPVRQIVPQQAQVELGMTAATFRVPRPADVPGDGEPHRQTITIASLPAAFRYETAPKLSSFAYLKAAATNTTETPLMAGAVNVFVGPDFIGTGRIKTTAQGEAADLFLGIDEGIRVKREELKDRRSKSGFFRSRRSQVSGYKITVENYKDKPQHVVVFDQIPVSGTDQVKVSLGDTSLKPTKVDDATGKLTWELDLNPREKREITFEFTVDWPQDRQVNGL